MIGDLEIGQVGACFLLGAVNVVYTYILEHQGATHGEAVRGNYCEGLLCRVGQNTVFDVFWNQDPCQHALRPARVLANVLECWI
jgi:hypothetical protein